MSLIELQAWLPGSDLSDAPDHTFASDDQLVDAGFNPVLWGEGDGFLEIHADDPDTQYLQRRGFIRAVRTDTDEGLFWWILEEGSVKLLSNPGKVQKVIRWDGRGMLYYLDRYKLGQAVWAPGQPNRGSVSVIDYWTWIDQPMIAILTRFMEEGQFDTRADFLDKLDYDFSRTQDSNGNSLTDLAEYQVRIGTGGLTLAADAMRQGNLLQILPTSPPVLQAFRALTEYRTDRTSGTYAANKVRFAAGQNIATELPHKIVALRERTHTLTRRQDGQYATEALNGSGEPYMEFMEVPHTSDPDAVEAFVGESHLSRQKQSTVAVIRHKIGPGGTSGAQGYFPSPAGHYWLGDLVTAHSGTGEYDLNEQTLEVAGIRYFLRGADWMVEAQLGAQVITSAGAPVNIPTGGPTVPAGPRVELCQPGSTSTGFEAIGSVGSAASNSGDDHPSDHWPGKVEERLEITAGSAIPAGDTLFAVVAWNRDTPNATRPSIVYDEQGNEWTLDAESDPVGSSSYITQIWRCFVLTQIESGDYIRWAAETGTVENDAQLLSNARAFGVYQFRGVEQGQTPNVGTAAGTFGSTHTVAAPAGELVIGSLARHEGTVTGDGDWQAMVAWLETSTGAGVNKIGIFGQYKLAVTSENWVTTGSGSKDWSGIAVGYSIGTVTLDGPPAELVGTSIYAARCDHNHYAEDLLTEETNDDLTLQPDGAGGVEWAAVPVPSIDSLATAETDTALVLKPDGAGGVEWGADATGGGGGSLSYAENTLTGADIALGGSAAFANACSVSLAAGTWLIHGHISFRAAATVASRYVAELYDGTTVHASSEAGHISLSPHFVQQALTAIITLGSTTTVYLRGRQVGTESNRFICYQTLDGSSPAATQMTAVQIG